MSHQGRLRDSGSAEQHQDLHKALTWLMKGADLSAVRWRCDCLWTVPALVMAAAMWVWSGDVTLGTRFEQATKIVARMLGMETLKGVSYQAFLKLLRKWSPVILPALANAFRRRMQTVFAVGWLIAGFVAFGVDGSRLGMTRTKKNKRWSAGAGAHCRQKNSRPCKRRKRSHRQSHEARQKKAESPQMWVTTIWHLGLGLPWSWLLGPSDSSERTHLLDMLGLLPDNSILVMDAGFHGYEFWNGIVDKSHHFLCRVGSNVHLLRKLCHVEERAGFVYCWPHYAAKKEQEPLKLRLIVLRHGKKPVYLVTSVLDDKRLSDEQAAELYLNRWGIEVYYRNLKQTYELAKLRSHVPENALIEAEWSILGLWAMTLHAQSQLSSMHIDIHQLSVAKMLRAYRAVMNEYKNVPEQGERLRERLRGCVQDSYERTSKTSHNFPRKRQRNPAGKPLTQVATAAQRKLAKQLATNTCEGLTA